MKPKVWIGLTAIVGTVVAGIWLARYEAPRMSAPSEGGEQTGDPAVPTESAPRVQVNAAAQTSGAVPAGPEWSIRGVVVDSVGTAVDAVRVVFVPSVGSESTVETLTGPDGGFVVPVDGADVCGQLVAFKEGERSLRSRVDGCCAGHYFEMRLGAVCDLTVNVVGSNGPIENARVEVWRRAMDERSVDVEVETTDEAGHAYFDSVSRDVYYVRASADSHASGEAERVSLLKGSREVDLVLVEGRRLRGGVFIRGSELPVKGAIVEYGREKVVTDDDGEFELDTWSMIDTPIVSVCAEGYSRSEVFVENPDRYLPVLLSPGRMISGRVLHMNGAATARVHAMTETLSGVGRRVSRVESWSREGGDFEVGPVANGVAVSVLIESDAGVAHRAVEAGSGDVDLGEVRLGGWCDLIGAVETGVGQPIAGAWVNAVTIGGYGAALRDRTRVSSDTEGRFSMRRLPEGEYRISASRSGMPDIEENVVLRPGENSVSLVAPGGRDLAVTVLDQDGIPMERVALSVVLDDNRGALARESTDEDGIALFGNLPLEPLLLQVIPAQGAYGGVRVPVSEGERATTIYLERRLAVSGRCQRTDGTVVGGLQIDAQCASTLRYLRSTSTKEDGSFSMEFDARDGVVELVVVGLSGDSYQNVQLESERWNGQVRVAPPADDVILVVEKEPSLEFDVVVVTPSGDPSPGAFVAASGRGLAASEALKTGNDDGRVRVIAPRGVPLTLTAAPAKNGPLVRSEEVVLRPDGSPVILTLREGVRFHGVCLNAEGKPLARSQVAVYPVDETGSSKAGAFLPALISDGDGAFEVWVEEAEEYVVSCRSRGGESQGPASWELRVARRDVGGLQLRSPSAERE